MKAPGPAQRHGIGIVGYGLIGARRAAVAQAHPECRVEVVAEVSAEGRERCAAQLGVRTVADWEEVVTDGAVDIVVVATPNLVAIPIALRALAEGKHVLLEKPVGNSYAHARQLADAAHNRVLKIGFNHRYHPALRAAAALVGRQELGAVINVRGRYGHGGRPGYDQEWRGQAHLSGGGELLDQGVHLLDLLHGLLGQPCTVAAMLQTAVWPVAPLEDNALALLQYPGGVMASIHTSWTQWKNLFSLEVFCQRGAILVEGLGGSYGGERLIVDRRQPQGAPERQVTEYSGPDESWTIEWQEYLEAIENRTPYSGNPKDSMAVMAVVDALYQSARTRRFVDLDTAVAPLPAEVSL